MSNVLTVDAQTENVNRRASLLFAEQYEKILCRTDRLFASLLFVEWLGAILAALLISPRTWSGAQSEIHLHVWTALLLGGAVVSLPIYLGLRAPGLAAKQRPQVARRWRSSVQREVWALRPSA